MTGGGMAEGQLSEADSEARKERWSWTKTKKHHDK